MSAPVHPRVHLSSDATAGLDAVETPLTVPTEQSRTFATVGMRQRFEMFELFKTLERTETPEMGNLTGPVDVLEPAAASASVTRGRVAGLLALVIVLALVGAWLAGWRTHVMTTASMGTAAPVGTLVISEPAAASTVRVGQIIVFHPPNQPDTTFVHRVTHVTHTPSGPRFGTRGDINGSVDPWTLDGQDLIGRSVLRIPVAGYGLEMLPGALAATFLIILIALLIRPSRRRAAVILMASLAAAVLLFYYHPLAGVSLIAQTNHNGHGSASIVPTGILPVRVSAVGGTHVDLVAGHVGTVHVSHLPLNRPFALSAHVHLSGWWWLVLIAWALPILVSLRPRTESTSEPEPLLS